MMASLLSDLDRLLAFEVTITEARDGDKVFYINEPYVRESVCGRFRAKGSNHNLACANLQIS